MAGMMRQGLFLCRAAHASTRVVPSIHLYRDVNRSVTEKYSSTTEPISKMSSLVRQHVRADIPGLRISILKCRAETGTRPDSQRLLPGCRWLFNPG